MHPQAAIDFCNEDIAFMLAVVAKFPEKYLTSKYSEERDIAKSAFKPIDSSQLCVCSKCAGLGVIKYPPQAQRLALYCRPCTGTGYKDGPHFNSTRNIYFHPDSRKPEGWNPPEDWSHWEGK